MTHCLRISPPTRLPSYVSGETSQNLKLVIERLIADERRGRQLDRDGVADALFAWCQAHARWQGVARDDVDDVVSSTCLALFRRWEDRTSSFEATARMTGAAVRNRSIDEHRGRSRRREVSLEIPRREDDDAEGQYPADPRARDMVDVIHDRDRLRSITPELRELARYLSEASEKVGLIDRYAVEGKRHDEIADLLSTRHGLSASHMGVRKAISRLMERFPQLRGRWERREQQAQVEQPA